MRDPKNLLSTLWLTFTLALPASVLVTPIRTSVLVIISSRPDCFGRNFALPPAQSTTRLSAAIATDAVPRMKALLSENEEQSSAGRRRWPSLR